MVPATTPTNAVVATSADTVSVCRNASLLATHAQMTVTAAQDTHAPTAVAVAPIPAKLSEDAILIRTAAQATTVGLITTAPYARVPETAQGARSAAPVTAAGTAPAHFWNAVQQMERAQKIQTVAMGLPARMEPARDTANNCGFSSCPRRQYHKLFINT